MNRVAFVLQIKPEQKDTLVANGKKSWDDITKTLDDLAMTNFSVWSICDFMFCYGETPLDSASWKLTNAVATIVAKLNGTCAVLAKPGTMRLMYHNIGVVREDKSLIRHRVFATHLKPNCADEYKARHDKLVEARGGAISDGPETNFTIWCADNEFNFGYCELVKSYDREMTEDEKQSSIAWETRQLEIMDWYSDDIDWITGDTHDPVQLLCQYK
ncbi:MAG: L-rhamnose mutarotase [Clostridiales bacterium]|nr:L-rhamnose mutarotase [Clostridiales bacterium]